MPKVVEIWLKCFEDVSQKYGPSSIRSSRIFWPILYILNVFVLLLCFEKVHNYVV